MAKGRKPKPTHLKRIEGNRGKRPLPQNEPQPEAARPNKPRDLSGEGSRLWDAACDALEDMGVLTKADGPALRMMCETWARYFEARRIVNAYGSLTYENESDGGILIKKNPAVGIMENAERSLRSWFSEFGMTPAARSRVEKALEDGEEDSIEALFTGEGRPGDAIRH